MPRTRMPKKAPDLDPNDAPDVSDETRGGAAIPVDGGVTPAEDGGNPQHPIHDEDQEDRTPGDYEREIDRLDAAIAERIR